MKCNISTPVTGDDFYGRKVELSRANRLLDGGQSFVLSAPRRIGKSSLAKRILEQQREKGAKTIYIDLESIETKEEFIALLLQSLNTAGIWNKTLNLGKSVIGKLLKSIKSIGNVVLDFSEFSEWDGIYTNIADAIDFHQNVVIVIDELSLFLQYLDKNGENDHEVKFLLNWLRGLRQKEGSNIKWILSGSIGLHNFTGMRNLSYTINDLAILDFDAMTAEEAKGFVLALSDAEGLGIAESDAEYLLQKIGWAVPYIIQLIINELINLKESDVAVSQETIDEAYDRIAESDYLNIWSERLLEYNGYADMARFILRELSKSEEGLAKEDLYQGYLKAFQLQDSFRLEHEMSEVLNMLERDSYIDRAEGKRRFRSPLLRDWWKRSFLD